MATNAFFMDLGDFDAPKGVNTNAHGPAGEASCFVHRILHILGRLENLLVVRAGRGHTKAELENIPRIPRKRRLSWCEEGAGFWRFEVSQAEMGPVEMLAEHTTEEQQVALFQQDDHQGTGGRVPENEEGPLVA